MTDRFVVRTVVVSLAVSVVTGVVTMALLSWAQLPIPDQFDRLITYLAGVMSGFLISTKIGPSPDAPPQPVVGVPGGEPVAVEVPAGD